MYKVILSREIKNNNVEKGFFIVSWRMAEIKVLFFVFFCLMNSQFFSFQILSTFQ